MKEQFSLEQIVEEFGKEPELVITSDKTFWEECRLDDDVAMRYAVFFHDKALGGCVVYGKYGHAEQTWTVNPHLRYLVKHLTEVITDKHHIMKYKGYTGSCAVSLEDGVLHGKLEGINDLVTYEADSVPSLTKAFHEAVDDYETEKLNN